VLCSLAVFLRDVDYSIQVPHIWDIWHIWDTYGTHDIYGTHTDVDYSIQVPHIYIYIYIYISYIYIYNVYLNQTHGVPTWWGLFCPGTRVYVYNIVCIYTYIGVHIYIHIYIYTLGYLKYIFFGNKLYLKKKFQI
jgi:hypothetical protein